MGVTVVEVMWVEIVNRVGIMVEVDTILVEVVKLVDTTMVEIMEVMVVWVEIVNRVDIMVEVDIILVEVVKRVDIIMVEITVATVVDMWVEAVVLDTPPEVKVEI